MRIIDKVYKYSLPIFITALTLYVGYLTYATYRVVKCDPYGTRDVYIFVHGEFMKGKQIGFECSWHPTESWTINVQPGIMVPVHF